MVVAIVIAASILIKMYVIVPVSPDQACVSAGGTVITQLCCGSASDFPNTCAIGACGCSPSNSHDVKVCDCGEGKCWDGTKCA